MRWIILLFPRFSMTFAVDMPPNSQTCGSERNECANEGTASFGAVPPAFLRVEGRVASADKALLIALPKLSKQGRWLFGTCTCALDTMPLDQMLPHHLRQASARNFDHRVLYIANSGRSTPEQLKSHAAMLRNIQEQELVDEVVNLTVIDHLQVARQGMDEESAKEFVELAKMHRLGQYNVAMSAFLAKCLESFDHCAWMDADIFVHRGSLPWVDEAVLSLAHYPEKMISTVTQIPHPHKEDGPGTFTSRHFVYHRERLQRLLPFTEVHAETSETFESIVNENIERHYGEDQACCLETGRFGSWVIHPPENMEQLGLVLGTCKSLNRSVSGLIDIVEMGGYGGEDASKWRDEIDDDTMCGQRWHRGLNQYCASEAFATTSPSRKDVGSNIAANGRLLNRSQPIEPDVLFISSQGDREPHSILMSGVKRDGTEHVRCKSFEDSLVSGWHRKRRMFRDVVDMLEEFKLDCFEGEKMKNNDLAKLEGFKTQWSKLACIKRQAL